MTNKQIALCLDTATCKNPAIIGLEGESLEAHGWLQVFNDGLQARKCLKSDDSYKEAWIVSCEGPEPINLAATIKGDRPDMHVCLVSAEGSGSLYSRAHTARIDEVLDLTAFLRHYLSTKQRMANASTLSPLVSADPKSKIQRINSSQRRQEGINRDRSEGLAIQPSSSRKRNGFLITVVSGSGGAGKSTVSALAACKAAAKGMRTLLLDCDLQFGDASSMFPSEQPLAIDEALNHRDRLQRWLSQNRPLSVLSAPDRLETAETIVEALPRLLDELASCFDVIVVNTGATWAEQHAVLLERSTAVLFLIDQRGSSIRACRHALDLCSRCGIASTPFQFALNRCSKNAPFTSIDISCVLQGATVFELRDGGREVEELLAGGAAKELVSSNNDFVRSMDTMLAHLLPLKEMGSAVQEEKQTGLFWRGRHGVRRKMRAAS